MKPLFSRKIAFSCLGIAAIALTVSAHAATIVVNSLADDVFPDATGAIFDYAGAPVVLSASKCTLRMAIASANLDMAVGGASLGCAAGSGPDTVSLAGVSGVIQLQDRAMSVAPITPEPTPPTSYQSAMLFVARALTISGPGSASLTISAQNIPSFGHRIITVSDGDNTLDTPFAMSGLTLQSGRVVGGGGGCMFSRESITLTDIVFDACESVGNQTAGAFPALQGFGGALGVSNPILAGNSFPNVSINQSLFKSNRSLRGTSTTRPDNGAAYFGSSTTQVGAVTLTNSRFVGNSAERGGAFQIFNANSVSITNTDVLSNAATGLAATGGGRYGGFNIGAIVGDVALNQVRVVGNTANEERGGFSILTVGGTTTIADSSIIGNRAVNGRIGGFEVLTDTFDASGNCLAASKHDVTITNTLVRGNVASTNTGGLRILCSGNVAVTNTQIEANQVSGSALAGSGGNSAGQISTNSSVAMTDVTVSGNQTNAGAVITPGVANGGFSVLTVSDTPSFIGTGLAVHDNYAAENEGGMTLRASGAARNFVLSQSAFYNNRAKAFQALLIDATGNYTLRNTTISGNASTTTSGTAFGINATATAGTNAIVLDNVTSARNGATSNAFDVSSWNGTANATVTVRNSIFGQYQFGNGSGPVSNPVIAGVTYAYSNSIVENGGNMPAGACGTNAVVCNVDAKLEGLSANGGSTLSHALRAGSPALDAGDNAVVAAVAFDQRGTGYPRIVNGTVDIGSFESPALATVVACKLDMDGDNQPRASKEGLVLLRAMLGFSGGAVVNGTGITQAQWDSARTNLNANCGTNFAP